MDTLLALDEDLKQIPNITLSNTVYSYEYHLSNGNQAISDQLKEKIMTDIENDHMAPYYVHLCSKFSWVVDEVKLNQMREMNKEHEEKIAKQHADAVENAGDMELLDALFAKARHYATIGDCEESLKAYDEILALKKVSSGKKIDATLDKMRVAFFTLDKPKIKILLEEARKLIDFGGDWDRRNRLKVYEAYYLLAAREIRQASTILIECIATFSCVELASYNDFMSLAITTSLINLPRAQLKDQVVKNPQVISVIREFPHFERLLLSLYNCDYSSFFRSIVEVHPIIAANRYLGPHVSYIIREYRVTAYTQFLDAYKSVMLSSMAQQFGIETSLLDRELSRFIASGRLNAKIDKVGDIIETCRPDKKNRQYQDVIKKGDALLNQIQKLARVIQILLRKQMAAPTPKTQIVNGKEYLSCMNIYDLHSFCISFRSQLNQVRRFGRMQACGELFYDWKKCMTAKVVGEDDKKQELLESMTVTHPEIVINDVWEYKTKPQWDTDWNAK